MHLYYVLTPENRGIYYAKYYVCVFGGGGWLIEKKLRDDEGKEKQRKMYEERIERLFFWGLQTVSRGGAACLPHLCPFENKN